MTKAEQLKARVYAIEILEQRMKENERQIEWNTPTDGAEISEYTEREIREAKSNIEQIKFIIEEIAK